MHHLRVKKSALLLIFSNQISTWGIAIRHDTVAISANSHDITVLDHHLTFKRQLTGHSNNIPCIAFDEDGDVYSVSIDCSVTKWSAKNTTASLTDWYVIYYFKNAGAGVASSSKLKTSLAWIMTTVHDSPSVSHHGHTGKQYHDILKSHMMMT